MQEHPLLMQGPLVRATLEGRKTQTRRPLRNQPPSGYHLVRVCGPWAEFENDGPTLAKYSTKSPLGEAGDRLWVRETWGIGARPCPVEGGREGIEYRADEGFQEDDISLLPLYSVDPPEGHTLDEYCKRGWRPSIHMPRWACRLVLPLVSVRVERVQDITDEDAEAEGIREWAKTDPKLCALRAAGFAVPSRPKFLFRLCWISIYGEGSWDANPWVWVAEWKEIEGRK